MKTILPLQTDQYKMNSHFAILPEETERVYSYMEARKGAKYPAVIFFGLQYYIKRYFLKPVTKEDVDYAEAFAKFTNQHDNCFNREGWDYIVNELGGKLPLRIKAVPEGTIVPTGNVLLTIENTDDKCAWLTNSPTETILMKLWYPTTLAYRSNHNTEVIAKAFDRSSMLPREIAKHLYIDFGYRGVTSEEQAAIGGAAHLLSNFGSDTNAGTQMLLEYYTKFDMTPEGFSNLPKCSISYGVPASEHSIATARGEEGEFGYYENMLDTFPNGLVSIVADSYNVTRFVEEYTLRLRDKIISRFENGTADLNRTIIRPDSLRSEDDTPVKQVIWLHTALEKIFGHTVNDKGYKVLHPAVGVLWGDGISDAEIEQIYTELMDVGWSIENLAVGQGGGLLNAGDNNTRDTNRFAIKCSAQKQNGEWVDIQKNPLDTSKKSKAGRLVLTKTPTGEYATRKLDDLNSYDNYYVDELVTVFENGELKVEYDLEEIRNRITS